MSDNNNERKFVYRVLDVFDFEGTSDLGTVGIVKGTIQRNDSIYIRNYGDDDDEIVTSSIFAMDIDHKDAQTATDCFVALRVKEGLKENIKPGSVFFSSEDITDDEIREAYIDAIAGSYVGKRDLEIYDSELKKMSLTDCSEAWRIFCRVHEKDEDVDDAKIKEFRRKIGVMANAMAKKVLAADEIYYVKSKLTNEPYMFSKTSNRNGEYIFSPPEIHIFTTPYKKYGDDYPEDKYEIVKVENGDDGEGIKRFLTDTLYLNGALGVRVNYEIVAISAETFFKNPYNPELKENANVVTNPELVRWMLLRSQIGQAETDDQKMIAQLYFRFFAYALVKARFLIPGQPVDPNEAPTRTEGDAIESKIKFPIMVGGEGEKNVLFLYTDAKRMFMNYDRSFGGFIQTLDNFIDKFDCAINSAKGYGAGFLATKDVYDAMKKLIDAEETRAKMNEKKDTDNE